MKAIDILVEEHRVIERVLDLLEAAAKKLENGQYVPPEFFLLAVDFIRGFADGCHHQKEEGVLFVRMQAQGIPTDGCPLGVMLAEHALARQYTRALLTAAQDLHAGDMSAVNRAIQSSRSYVALLRQHIFKEDNILFPLAEQVIPTELHPQVWGDFEQAELEDGAHEKYLALSRSLAQHIAA